MAHLSVAPHVVRSYELDSYGHVNNAVYMQWLEHGRSRLLQDFGFTYNNIEDRWGVRLVLVGTKIDFQVGLRLDDRIRITTRVSRMGRTSVTFAQEILREEPEGPPTVAAVAETAIVFTDPAMTGARPIPEEFRRIYG
jgi:acyl-CoA thioester hydrolase